MQGQRRAPDVLKERVMSLRTAILGLLAGLLIAAAPGARASAQPCCGPITADGMKLAHLLDTSGVDHLWLIAQHVYWDTGEPDPARPGGTNHTTHCSAYAAAMAQRAGVYLLRPPEHGQTLLANAQMGWLDSGAAREDGWRPVATPAAAQAAANRGELVVASFQNPDPRRPGHIAILRPSEKTPAELDRDGPQEAQAGTHNWLSTTVADGFHGHRGAWEPGGTGAIRFFAHPVAWPPAG
jgi:hypothetical protein